MPIYFCHLCGTQLEQCFTERDDYFYLSYECPTHPAAERWPVPESTRIEGV